MNSSLPPTVDRSKDTHSEHFDWRFEEPQKFLEAWKTTYVCVFTGRFTTVREYVNLLCNLDSGRIWQDKDETYYWTHTCVHTQPMKYEFAHDVYVTLIGQENITAFTN